MVYAVYFSPTGTSKKNAFAVAKVFSGEIIEIDLTVLSQAKSLNASQDDLVVFSFPVYGGLILGEALDAIKEFTGDNTPCVCLVTYGNRAYDFALAQLCTCVKKLGFMPFAGGGLIGQHTYGEIATGRPNADDIIETTNFFRPLVKSLQNGEISEMAEYTGYNGEGRGKGGRFFPSTNEHCVSCGICAKMCPIGAISGDDFKVDEKKCIACFRCINICKQNAKNMQDPAYIEFAKSFSERLKDRRENEYFKN
ncbi:MAG: 4Fe-4S binding protein [Bacillota bacterium]